MADASDLEGRLGRLERYCKRLLVGMIALVLVGALLVAGIILRVPSVVSAQRFVLKDRSGATRGEWGPLDMIAGEVDGQPVSTSLTCLDIRAPTGGIRVRECAPWDGPGPSDLVLSNETGAKVQLYADAFQASARFLAKRTIQETKPSSELTLSAWHMGANLRVKHEPTGAALLEAHGLTLRDPKGAAVAKFPSADGPKHPANAAKGTERRN